MWLTYYREPEIEDNDFLNPDVPLQLNCTGCQEFSQPIHASSVRQDYYLFYLCSGEVVIRNPTVTCPHMEAGGLIVFEKDCPFSYSTFHQPATVHYFAHFTGYDAGNVLRQCGISTNTVYRIRDHEQMVRRFHSMFDAFIARDAFFDLDSTQRLISLLIAIGRDLAHSNVYTAREKYRELHNSLDFLHAHFTDDLTVGQLAEIEFLSESRYRAVFHEVMNLSPQEYIIRLRMGMARDLLTNSGLSIAEIAQTVGYPDPRYFARIFRKKHSLTPREYRKNNGD